MNLSLSYPSALLDTLFSGKDVSYLSNLSMDVNSIVVVYLLMD